MVVRLVFRMAGLLLILLLLTCDGRWTGAATATCTIVYLGIA